MNSFKKKKYAQKYYSYIRNKEYPTDAIYVANNTGLTVEQILLIRNYIFCSKSWLGLKKSQARFDIARSWKRLSGHNCNYYAHDMLLVCQVLYEIKLVSNGLSKHKAHMKARKRYNYELENRNFYKRKRFEML